MRVFISYRRGPTTDITGRIRDHLAARLGVDVVFRDFDSVRPGEDFNQRVDDELETISVLVLVIGPDFLRDGSLFRPDDWVRVEVEGALSRAGVRIIPVLVNGAELPARTELPPSLQPLLRFNALRIDSGADFTHHIERLLTAIAPSKIGAGSRSRSLGAKTLAIAGGVVFAAALGGAVVGRAIGTRGTPTPLGAIAAEPGFSPSVGLQSAQAVVTPPSSTPGALPEPSVLPAVSASSAPDAPLPSSRALKAQAPAVDRFKTPECLESSKRPSPEDVKRELLACWKNTEGADPEHPSASVWFVAETLVGTLDGPKFLDNPRFAQCARRAFDRILACMLPGESLARTNLVLPGKEVGPPFPSEAEARAALLPCWTQNEGGIPGSPARKANFQVSYSFMSYGFIPPCPKCTGYLSCARALGEGYKKRAKAGDGLKFVIELPPGPEAN